MFKHILVAVTLFVCLTGNAMAFDDAKWQGLFRTAQTLLEGKKPALAEAQLRAALSDEMPDNLRIATLTHLCMALYLQSKHQEAVAVATESVKLIEAREPNNLQALATSASILNMSAAKVGDTAAATLADEKLEYLKGEMVLQAWSTDERTGEKLHLHSGIRFPASFGTFGDALPMAYKPDGTDVSMNYQGTGPAPGLLTIYVTEFHDRSIASHIEDASQSIQITAGNTAPISQGRDRHRARRRNDPGPAAYVGIRRSGRACPGQRDGVSARQVSHQVPRHLSGRRQGRLRSGAAQSHGIVLVARRILTAAAALLAAPAAALLIRSPARWRISFMRRRAAATALAEASRIRAS